MEIGHLWKTERRVVTTGIAERLTGICISILITIGLIGIVFFTVVVAIYCVATRARIVSLATRPIAIAIDPVLVIVVA